MFAADLHPGDYASDAVRFSQVLPFAVLGTFALGQITGAEHLARAPANSAAGQNKVSVHQLRTPSKAQSDDEIADRRNVNSFA